MKKKSKALAKKSSRATDKIAKKRVRSSPIPAETAAANPTMFVAAIRELVGISGDMRDLLVEIRDLLAEGAEEQGQAQEGPGTGVEAVIVAETEPDEDVENM
jgi:hypothetical protein